MDNRITGMASGMNIDQWVKDLMRAERQPLVRMEQESQRLEYKMEDYREMNREYRTFSDSIFDGIMRSANGNAKQASSSNESIVEANATSDADNTNYTISNIEQLAKAASTTSVDPVQNGDGEVADPEASLADQFGYGEDEEISFTITTYNEAGEAQEQDFTFTGEDSLNDVVNGINRSDAGVNVFFERGSGNLSVTRSETGVFSPDGESEISFNGDFLTNDLNLTGEVSGAQNAMFDMNGITGVERRSNTFTENGVEFTLKNTAPDQTVNVNVSPDTQNIKDTIMSFVEDYNAMIENTDEKLSEEYYRDYAPLTDDQRDEMSETEIERWEERSQSGYLRRDDILSSGLSSMRRDMYTPVDTGSGSAFDQLSEIGITTTSNYMDRGKLEVDETKLEQAIQADSDAVFDMFAADGETYEEKGLARRVRDSLDNTMDRISERAGGPTVPNPDSFTIGREMNDLADRMSNFEQRLQKTEERYWDQFTRMEQAIADANAQAQQIQQQLGGGGMGGMM
ncbi:flagellar hook-associated protein 2 [Salibacterium aidingense]|uniref:flagellar hook-associated protein 2 n=1 Tax=Salibacterium aidingense TaxID=384933 RepID=UPI003BCB0A3E